MSNALRVAIGPNPNPNPNPVFSAQPAQTASLAPDASAPSPDQVGPSLAEAIRSTLAPVKVKDDAVAALRQLLRIESEIRECTGMDALGLLLVNEVRKACGFRQVMLFSLNEKTLRLERASGSQEIDRGSPTVLWLQQHIPACYTSDNWTKAGAFSLVAGGLATEETARTYPFREGYFLPLRYGSTAPNYALVVLHDTLPAEQGLTIAARIVQTASHASVVLTHKSARTPISRKMKHILAGGTLLGVAALFWPVPMTALAPMEISPKQAFVVAAPIDGVIEDIVLAPNSEVKAGDVLIRYVDTIPRNQLALAEREVSLAEARLRQIQQSAFMDDKARRDLAQMRAELVLKLAERDFARDTFEKSVIRAPSDGIVVYSDRKDWLGRPVSTGQRILEIATTDALEVQANLPVAEVLDLKPGNHMRIFLDGSPLKPLAAKVVSMNHNAKMVEGQGLSYRITGMLEEGQPLPRLGVRGTAQVFSEKVALGYYLLRRPITWLRQKVGL